MKRFDQINMIPFIDVMLVLLAIVLTTATFVSQGLIEINVPEAESAVVQPQTDQAIEIAINENQQLYLDEQLITQAMLEEKLSSVTKDASIVLRVDKAVPFEQFVAVVDVLKANSLEKLSIITREK